MKKFEKIFYLWLEFIINGGTQTNNDKLTSFYMLNLFRCKNSFNFIILTSNFLLLPLSMDLLQSLSDYYFFDFYLLTLL